MTHISQKWDRILKLLFEYSNDKFSVREISKKTKIPSSSVQRYLTKLKKQGFILKENMANITPYFKLKKTFFVIDKMFKIGLIDFLNKELNPSVVVLFGSIRKGEYEKASDIDIFVESSIKKTVDFGIYEKKLGHKIQLFIEGDVNNLHLNLRSNVINGIKLAGYLKIK